jgi:isoquinoline 1-oxidoreductase alpha subunit
MVMGAAALLASNAKPGKDEIVRQMSGHICRCGTYPRILAAVQRAASKMKKA